MPNIKPEHVEVVDKEIINFQANQAFDAYANDKGHYVAEYVEGLENKIEMDAEVIGTQHLRIVELQSQLLTTELQMGKIREALELLLPQFEYSYIDWGKINSQSQDYNKNYKPEFPPIHAIAKEALSTTSSTPMIEEIVKGLELIKSKTSQVGYDSGVEGAKGNGA